MARKRFTEREVIETLAWQGIFVTCFRCRAPFYTPAPTGGMFNLSDKIEREHVTEIALGGPDTPKNCRYSCAPCHAKITNGTKATSAGSSKQRIAKVKRILADKPSKRPMQNSARQLPSRPMQSAPFPQRKQAWQKRRAQR